MRIAVGDAAPKSAILRGRLSTSILSSVQLKTRQITPSLAWPDLGVDRKGGNPLSVERFETIEKHGGTRVPSV